MEKMFMVVCLLTGASVCGTAKHSATLLEILHNKRQEKDTVLVLKDLDFDVVTCVFSDGFPITQSSDSAVDKGTRQFFVKNASIAPVLKSKKGALHSQNSNIHSIAIREVAGPNSGVMFDVTYDPDRVIFDYDVYSRVNGKRKLVFYFKDKQLLAKIEKKKDIPPIVRTSLDPIVVIDCGHGGADSGVIGYNKSTEKNICLAVGKKIAEQLKKKGIRTILTREADEYLSLEERVRSARALDPQLFVSIHANAAANKNSSGIETYYFDRYACSLRDNRTCIAEYVDDYQKKLASANKEFAETIQKMVCKVVADEYSPIDRRAKSEALQVLMGTNMPSALIEIGFLTSKQEADLLVQEMYQQCMARGISAGIRQFLVYNNMLLDRL